MFLRVLIIFTTTLLFSSLTLSAQHTNVRISNQNLPNEPSICINPKNPKQVVAAANLNNVFYSSDGGATWKQTPVSCPYGIWGDPVLITDTTGAFYYLHLSNPQNGSWIDRIVVQKSTDGGKTYSDGTYCGENHPKDQDKHWLCVDPRTDVVYCTWTEFDEYNNTDTARYKSRILFSKSTDGGRTWSPALKINQFDGDCLDDDNTTEGAVPAVGPNGELYVAWAWNDKIWFDYSLDGGTTWLERDIFVAQQPGGWTYDVFGISRCNGLPVLDCDRSNGPNRGTLYINWSDQRNGDTDTDIWLSRSTDGGKTWSSALRVNNDPPGKDQFLTWLTVDQVTGYLYAVFYDRRAYTDNKTDVYLAVSRNGGRSFENMKISESPFDPIKYVFFGDYNHISAHNGRVRPIWTRLDNKVLSVWTALIDFK
jgi:hypothetical protein